MFQIFTLEGKQDRLRVNVPNIEFTKLTHVQFISCVLDEEVGDEY